MDRMIKKKLSLIQVLSMFIGLSCGSYFLVNFGTKMHEIGVLSLLIATVFMCLFYYNFMMLLEDLSNSTNAVDIQGIVMAVQPKYKTICTWLFYIYFIIVLTVMTSMVKTTLNCFGCIPDIVQYVLMFSVLLLGGKYGNLLVRANFLLNIIKFFFVFSFIIAGIFFLYKHPEVSTLKKNISLGTNFDQIIAGLLFSSACFGGIEALLHVKGDMKEKDFRRAMRIVPVMAGSIFTIIILMSGFVFTPAEQGNNLIPAFFKNKLDLLLMNRIELTLLFIVQLTSTMISLYLASKMGKLCLPQFVKANTFGISSVTVALWAITFFVVGNNIFFIFEIVMCIIWIHFPVLHILISRKLKKKVNLQAVVFFVVFLFLLIKSVYDVAT